MKRILIIKSFLFLLLLTGAGIAVISCSSEVEELEQQAFSISLTTINEKGEYTTVFGSKENILFDLTIKNNTKDTIFVDELFPVEIVHSFKLYSSNGEFVVFPFNGIDWIKLQTTAYTIMPYESKKWQCLYLTHPTEIDLESPFVSSKLKTPLSQGSYYLLYTITLINETKVGKIEFKIE